MKTASEEFEKTDAGRILARFSELSGLRDLPYDLKRRSDGDVLVIRVAHPSERLYKLLAQSEQEVTRETLFPTRAHLKADAPQDRLHRPEVELYIKVLSESLAVTKESFRRGFFDRYISSVFGAEDQVLSEANHLVLGRRGSGKSSLLLYAMSKREAARQPNVWIELQVYQNRTDTGVIADVLWGLLDQVAQNIGNTPALSDVMNRVEALTREEVEPGLDTIKRMLPGIRRLLAVLGHQGKSLFVFLDDLHVLPVEVQPALLGVLNAVARGNNVYLKISSIESFTRTWDPVTREGLEVVHDVQVLKLDYNLTKPRKAREHIESILNAHAMYSGLPSARYLCTEADVMSRLVWAAAGVPRDALNLFAQAITAAVVDDQQRVTITNVNKAASEAVSDKLRDVQLDGSGHYDDAMALLERIKKLCIQERKTNAFLVAVAHDDPTYEGVLRLADLRLLHVVHEGITVREAGRKYVALILDYGFYVGVRAAKSIDLFDPPKGRGQYETLRALPRL